MIDHAAFYVSPPLLGEWRALNTPAERIPSHGTDRYGQRYAFDFCQTDEEGQRLYDGSMFSHFIWFKPADQFYCWGSPVFAAFAGTVVGVSDGSPDRNRVNFFWELLRANILARPPLPKALPSLLGNYVMVRGEVGVALYAHLQQGSISVREGESVLEGSQLGTVGNSGNTTMPHLHFHVMTDASIFSATGVYCGFKDYEQFAGCNWTNVANGIPRLMERVRFLRKCANDAT